MWLFLAFFACTPSTHRVGLALVDQGRQPEAVRYWLTHGDEKSALEDARFFALDACNTLESVAQEHEARREREEALAVWEEALQLDEALTRAALPRCPPELAENAEESRQALARALLDDASAALKIGAHDLSIPKLERTLALYPRHPEAQALLVASLHLRAQEHLAARRYAESEADYASILSLAPDEVARAWLGAIHLAWGDAWMKAGACRAALDRYLLADAHGAPSAQVDQSVAKARDCARVDLIPVPAETALAPGESAIDYAAAFSDSLEAAILARATPHLHLLDPGSPQAAEPPSAGRRFRVRGRITQAVVEDQPEQIIERTGSGHWLVLCDIDGLIDPHGKELCEDRVALQWRETRQSRVVRVDGAIRLIDAQSGEQVLTAPVHVEITESRAKTDGFSTLGSNERLAVSAKADLRVAKLDPELLSLLEAPTPLPPVSRQAAQGAAALAEEAATALLATLDRDPEVTPPRTLEITPPLLHPEDLEFGGSAPTAEPTPEPPPQPAPEGLPAAAPSSQDTPIPPE